MWIKTHRCFVRMKDPYLIDASSPSTYKSRHKKGYNKVKDSTEHTTKYRSKGNPTIKPWWARPKTQHQAPTLSSTDKTFSQNGHRV